MSSSVVPFSFCLHIFPSIRIFSSESALRIRWPKYWCFSFSISPSSEYSGLTSFRIDWFDLHAVDSREADSLGSQTHFSDVCAARSNFSCQPIFCISLSHTCCGVQKRLRIYDLLIIHLFLFPGVAVYFSLFISFT